MFYVLCYYYVYLPFSEDLYTLIESTLLFRARDRLAVVRVQAVLALKRIQDTASVADVLLNMMSTDPAKYDNIFNMGGGNL